MKPPDRKLSDYSEILRIHERAIPEVVERVYRVLARAKALALPRRTIRARIISSDCHHSQRR